MKQIILISLGILLLVQWSEVVFADDSYKDSVNINRFTFSEKTVMDKYTELTWMRNANLDEQDWDGAFKLVKELNRKKYSGYNDWRLPSFQELST